MNGYGLYLWGSVGVFVGALAIEWIVLRNAHIAVRERIVRLRRKEAS